MDEYTDFGRRYEIGRIVSHFRSTLMRELDYQKKSMQLKELRANLSEFKHLLVPEVIDDYSTSQVLTMEYLAGTKITSLAGVVLADLNGEALAEELFRAYLKQIIVDGCFHADPHPGNLLLTPCRHPRFRHGRPHQPAHTGPAHPPVGRHRGWKRIANRGGRHADR